MAPTFSVVIPVFNAASTVGRAIESVLGQRWGVQELIVVDDGSADDSAEEVARFGNRVTYIRQDNAGVSAARNRGAEVATGEWLAFLDADDWYYPDRLRRHAEWIARDGRLDFLTGDYDYRRADGSRISGSMEQHESGRAMLRKAAGNREVLMTQADLSLFIAAHFGDTHTLSVRRSTFAQVGGYPEGFKVCEDVFFLARLCAVSCRVGVVCEPLAAYVIHDDSATRRDRLRAQMENVRALKALTAEAAGFPAAIRNGVKTRLRHGRLNLGYALVRLGRRRDALAAVLPTIWENPGPWGFRDAISMLLG